MTEKLPPVTDKGKVLTLSDADISSQRSVSRRSLLGTLGLGAGVAAAAVIGAVRPAEARSDRRRCWRDNDRGDRATVYCDND
jgi:hypothetical protein